MNRFQGFVDYSSCFPQSDTLWVVIGWIIFTGTVVSLIPQIQIIISKKSSFGLNSFSIIITSFGQFIILINIMCLRSSDFMGAKQQPLTRVMDRFMTFLNAFVLWILYLCVLFLNYVFFDTTTRSFRSDQQIRNERRRSIVMTIVGVCAQLGAIIVYVAVVFTTGFDSGVMRNLGKLLGSLSCGLVFTQYLPQMITTCRLKNHGSLSLILLGIQAPGGAVNAMFMCFGQSDHWTTWMSTLSAAIQQFVLLGICLMFRYRNKHLNEQAPLIDPEK